MKLSEAIRLGEFALKPIYKSWIESHDGKPCFGCAVGRACIAAGYQVQHDSETIHNLSLFFDQMWPWTKAYKIPRSLVSFGTLNHMLQYISYLYEVSHWPMQQIADLVAIIEPQENAHDLQPESVKAVSHMSHSKDVVAGGVD